MRTIIVDGEDSYDNWGLLLTEMELKPPEARLQLIDVPGGNGSIDLTDALTGDVTFGDREQSFSFEAIMPDDFEAIKTRLSNKLHGRRLKYRLSWDRGYEYEGRFEIDEYPQPVSIGIIRVKVTADPYKTRGPMAYQLNADGGRLYRFEAGRKPVQPVIECSAPTRVYHGGRELLLGAGTYRLNDVVFRQGWNEMYLNSREVKTVAWVEIEQGGAHQMTWDRMAAYRWDEIDQLNVGQEGVKARIWEDLASTTWAELAGETWDALAYKTEGYAPLSGDTITIVTYEWSDL